MATPDQSGSHDTTYVSVRAIERPDPCLLTLYLIQALAALILFPVVFLPLYFKFRTLRYSFDEEGISARWGIFLRREIYLTYQRIQDIHVSRNIIERWLGIGRVEVQTASGSASAELVIEGMKDYELVRDFLYSRMRGTKAEPGSEPESEGAAGAGESEAVALLREIRDEVVAARRALEESGR